MEEENQYKKGLWTEEEDKMLVDYIKVHGRGQWNRIAQKTGLKRCGKSCRLRWVNYLSPNVKRGPFTEEEEDLIIRLHNLLGNRWALIAKRVPGRTDNQVKNCWNTYLSKKVAAKDQSCRLGIKEKHSRICKSSSETSRAVKLSRTTTFESDSSPFVNACTASDTAANKDTRGGAIEASRIQEPKFEDSHATPFWIFDDSLELDALGMELFDGYYFDLSWHHDRAF